MRKDGQLSEPEAARRQILQAYPRESDGFGCQLDRLAALAARICGAPIALVSIIESDRQVIIGKFGTDLEELPREQSFCAHAMHRTGCMVVPDTAQDPRFTDNPLVTGAPGIRFYAGQPLISKEGLPLGSFCVIDRQPREQLNDQEREGLETLAASAMALLEQKRLEENSRAAERLSQSAILDLEQRFYTLTDAMPQLVWSTDSEGRADYFNRGWCEFTGHPPEAGHDGKWARFLHPDDIAMAKEEWSHAVRTCGPYEIEYRLLHQDNDYRWVLARGVPMRDANGAVTRWIGTCTDIHEQKAAAKRLEILSRELNHRIKNIFAVIGGLISLTIRKQPDFAEAATALQRRVLALGRAHDFVRTHGGPELASHPHTSLKGMLEALLAPYQDGEKARIEVVGDDVTIDDRSATPLALFFHELATNAAKYGALSVDEGHVTITLHRDEEIEVAWQECDGPPINPGAEQGFGTTLVEMSITRQLGGSLAYDWSGKGLRVEAHIPPKAMAR